jgi:hypothetical protein
LLRFCDSPLGGVNFLRDRIKRDLKRRGCWHACFDRGGHTSLRVANILCGTIARLEDFDYKLVAGPADSVSFDRVNKLLKLRHKSLVATNARRLLQAAKCVYLGGRIVNAGKRRPRSFADFHKSLKLGIKCRLESRCCVGSIPRGGGGPLRPESGFSG